MTKYKTTLLLIVAIIIAGTWGTLNNQRQDFPAIPSNYIGITATYIGASAEDIEQEVAIPIEQAASNVEGIKNMRTSVADNFANITLEMEDLAGMDERVADIEAEVSAAGLPGDVETNVEIYDVVGPSIVYAVAPTMDADVSAEELIAQAEIAKEHLLSASSDIDHIDLNPKNEFEVRVELNEDALTDNGLNGQQVAQAVRSSLSSIPGGFFTNEDNQTFGISIGASVEDYEALKGLNIGGKRLDEVATVTRQATEADAVSLVGFVEDGTARSEEGVTLFIYKKEKGDIISIAEAIEEEVAAMQKDDVLSENVVLAELYDNSSYVEQQITDLLENGVLGLVLILVVLMFFINLRTGIVVALIIPLAFLTTLAVLYVIGFSINILTLFGLLLVLGILVDNAIVIAEGVTHQLEKGAKRTDAVLSTIQNLGPAVTAATLTTVVVFIPFASIGGIIGAFLKFIPYTIIIMLLASYALAMTVTPLFSRYLMKEETKEARKERGIPGWQKALILPLIVHWVQRGIDALEGMYEGALSNIFQKRWRRWGVVLVAALLLVGSIAQFATKLEVQQFPESDSEATSITFEFPATMTDQEKEDTIDLVMDEAVKTEEFESYYQFQGQVFMVFSEPKERIDGPSIEELNDTVNQHIESVSQELANREVSAESKVLGAGPPEDAYDVVVELRGESLDNLKDAAANLQEFLEEQDEVREFTNSVIDDQVTSVAVDLDSARLSDNNVDPLAAAGAVNMVFSEQTVGELTNAEGLSDDVVVFYSKESTDSVDDIRDVVVGASATGIVRLNDVADVEEVTALQNIQRLNEKRVANVSIKVKEGVVAADFEQKVRDHLTEDHLEKFGLDAEDVVYGGFTASQNESFDNLALVFMLAVIAVYLILVNQFNSFVQPGLIMFTIPLALIGVFPGLLAIGSSVNMISGLGIVALVGIVVNDAIVFVDYYNRTRRENPEMPLAKAAVVSGKARFKPILSTSITTIFGVLPLTVTDPFWQGLGTSLMTGLVCSTIGTLLVFPVLLTAADWLLQKISSACMRLMKRA